VRLLGSGWQKLGACHDSIVLKSRVESELVSERERSVRSPRASSQNTATKTERRIAAWWCGAVRGESERPVSRVSSQCDPHRPQDSVLAHPEARAYLGSGGGGSHAQQPGCERGRTQPRRWDGAQERGRGGRVPRHQVCKFPLIVWVYGEIPSLSHSFIRSFPFDRWTKGLNWVRNAAPKLNPILEAAYSSSAC
jgi:hypothetical protein